MTWFDENTIDHLQPKKHKDLMELKEKWNGSLSKQQKKIIHLKSLQSQLSNLGDQGAYVKIKELNPYSNHVEVETLLSLEGDNIPQIFNDIDVLLVNLEESVSEDQDNTLELFNDVVLASKRGVSDDE